MSSQIFENVPQKGPENSHINLAIGFWWLRWEFSDGACSPGACSIGKSGFRFWKSGFRICNRTQNPKTDFNAEISVFGFSFLPFDWEIRKRIWKIVLKNSGLARARLSREKKTAVHENSFANPFTDFPIERQKGNPWNPDLDFLIEIHPEDGFLGGEIRFRNSR